MQRVHASPQLPSLSPETHMPSSTLPAPSADADDLTVRLLRAHIPLSLLIDLAQPDPHSRELYANERVTPS